MTIEGGDERSTRVVEGEERRFRAGLAWRGERSGYALVYFVALDDGEPGDDRRDRRAPLGGNRDLRGLSDAELTDLLSAGKPLTATERRFRAPDGRLWLAQSVGPVWADGEPAEGSTGLLFTSLEGPHERLRGPGGHAGELDEGDLADAWRRSGAADGGGSGEGDGGEG